MLIVHFRLSVALLILGASVAGCASPGPTPLTHSIRQVAASDRQTVFDAAEVALVNHGFQIARADLASGLLTTLPVEGPPRAEEGRGGMRFSSRSRTRRVGEVRIEEAAQGYRVNCKVTIQEQITEAQRIFAEQRSAKDTGQTPIDRDAATTDEQNTVWQTVRRDQAAERQILETTLRILSQ